MGILATDDDFVKSTKHFCNLKRDIIKTMCKLDLYEAMENKELHNKLYKDRRSI